MQISICLLPTFPEYSIFVNVCVGTGAVPAQKTHFERLLAYVIFRLINAFAVFFFCSFSVSFSFSLICSATKFTLKSVVDGLFVQFLVVTVVCVIDVACFVFVRLFYIIASSFHRHKHTNYLDMRWILDIICILGASN